MYYNIESYRECMDLLDRPVLLIDNSWFFSYSCTSEDCKYKKYFPYSENCTFLIDKIEDGGCFLKTPSCVLRKVKPECKMVPVRMPYNKMQQALDYEFLQDIKKLYKESRGYDCKNLLLFEDWLVKNEAEDIVQNHGFYFENGEKISLVGK